MLKIKFLELAGNTRTVEANVGDSLREIAIGNGIDGIQGTCGGACSCATCHVKIDGEWASIVGQASEEEEIILSCLSDADATSRLACQIVVDDRFDGLMVRICEGLS